MRELRCVACNVVLDILAPELLKVICRRCHHKGRWLDDAEAPKAYEEGAACPLGG